MGHIQSAAIKTAFHTDTTTTVHFDTLGRAFLTTAHNKVNCKEHESDGKEDKFHTRVEMDIEGNQRIIRDALEQDIDKMGRMVVVYATTIYLAMAFINPAWKRESAGRLIV